MPPVKEVVTLHIGQAGCQVGLQVWELMCEEHGILPDGTRDEIHGEAAPDDPYNTFFAETAAGQHGMVFILYLVLAQKQNKI